MYTYFTISSILSCCVQAKYQVYNGRIEVMSVEVFLRISFNTLINTTVVATETK